MATWSISRLLRTSAALALFAALLAGVWQSYKHHVGDPSSLLQARWHQGQRLLDRNGTDLREIPSSAGQRGRSVTLEAMGDRLILATLVSEDKNFFQHQGVDAQAIVRALSQNVRHGRLVSGASTITQQLVKLLDHEGHPQHRTLVDKVREAARAENLERTLDKRTILENYLNRLGYGHGLTGPEAAAQGYFGVSARNLSWARAAFLAVLPRAPSFLDPYTHPERVTLRQRALLDDLLEQGFLSHADHARAIAEPAVPRQLRRPFLAPHFINALIQQDALSPSGTTVTTLDASLQHDVEGLLRTHLASLADFQASNAAVLVVDNKNGDVLAYLGSADFDNTQIDGQVDMVRARRQPGSTLKPFVYAMAFDRGHTAAEMLADVPTTFAERGSTYAPENFDGTFLGPISAREALAGSLNIPAIRLTAELSPGALLTTLHDFGFESLDRDAEHYGLSLSLGSGEVTLHELAAAYMTLARGGVRIPLRGIVSSDEAEGRRIMDADIAGLVTEVLADPLARVRGLHGQLPFDFGFAVALKTGTSSGFRDTWTVGYTHERTVAVWLGNATGSPTRGLTGASGAGSLFADVMRRAMADVAQRAPLWNEALLTVVEICPLSGKRKGPGCLEHVQRHFVHDHVPNEVCDLHVSVSGRVHSSSGQARFRCDPSGSTTVVALPEVFDAWLKTKPEGAPGQDPLGTPWYPRSALDGCNPNNNRTAELKIENPPAGSVFVLSRRGDSVAEAIDVTASFVGDAAMAHRMTVEFVVDGRVASRSMYPFRTTIPLTPGDHEITARPVDPGLAVRVTGSRFGVR